MQADGAAERDFKMWVMTLDGKNLIDAGYFHISRNNGGKPGERYAMLAFPSASGMQSGYICAMYADKERAVAELKKVFAAIEAGEKVYRFTK